MIIINLKIKRFFLPQSIMSAHCGLIEYESNDCYIENAIVVPNGIDNLKNIVSYKAVGVSARSRGVNENDIILVDKSREYLENDMVVIKYKGKEKVRGLGRKNNQNKWATFCDLKKEKTHDEKDFIGIVAKVYKPIEEQWQDLKSA